MAASAPDASAAQPPPTAVDAEATRHRVFAHDDLRITTCGSLAEAEARWRSAERELTLYGFQTFDWISTWFATIGQGQGIQPAIVFVATQDDRVVMMLPLGLQRSRLLVRIAFLGGDVTDYTAPILCARLAAGLDARSFNALWARIVAALPRADLLLLEKLASGIEALPNPLIWLSGCSRRTECHVVQLPKSMEALWETRSKRLRANTRRQRRHLGEAGPVTFSVATDAAEIRFVMHTLVRQKMRRMLETGALQPGETPNALAFYERLSLDHAATLAHVASLKVGDTMVATHLGMVFRNRFYYLIPGYEGGAWGRYSPGRMLLEELLAWSIEHGLTAFYLTTGNEPYKLEWADQTTTVYDWCHPLSLKGRIFVAQQEIRRRAGYYARRLVRKDSLKRLLPLPRQTD